MYLVMFKFFIGTPGPPSFSSGGGKCASFTHNTHIAWVPYTKSCTSSAHDSFNEGLGV